MYLSDLVSSLLSIATPSEPLAMSVSPPDDAELESSRVADDAARAFIFTSEKFWPIFLNHLKKIGGSTRPVQKVRLGSKGETPPKNGEGDRAEGDTCREETAGQPGAEVA